jgi:polyphenol oxidase
MIEPDRAGPGRLDLRFELPGGAHALFTARAEGNLSTMRGPGHEHGRRERERLREQLGLRRLCASRQVHGVAVQRVAALDDLPAQSGGGEPLAIDADGHATALPEVGVMVLTADCLPVILACEGAVAALHAGWRGLAGGVLEEGVRALRELGGAGEIAAVIGPGAGVCCYEVGEEVHAALEGGAGSRRLPSRAPLQPHPGGADSRRLPSRAPLQPHPGGAGDQRPPTQTPLQPHLGARREGRKLDLSALARDRLEAAGVGRIEEVGVCTICDARLFSHRREGLRAGRQAGIAWLR